ncbi:hypothetical protein C9J85_16880 [Haloferax sp. wsp5]|nr:hypothetical protein C9J85_16880 [Haloferax sp. wsp5]
MGNIYRRQTAVIGAGTALPMIAALLYDLGYTPHPAIDFTPGVFAVSMLFVGWALFEDESLSVRRCRVTPSSTISPTRSSLSTTTVSSSIITPRRPARWVIRSPTGSTSITSLPVFQTDRAWRGVLARGSITYYNARRRASPTSSGRIVVASSCSGTSPGSSAVRTDRSAAGRDPAVHRGRPPRRSRRWPSSSRRPCRPNAAGVILACLAILNRPSSARRSTVSLRMRHTGTVKARKSSGRRTGPVDSTVRERTDSTRSTTRYAAAWLPRRDGDHRIRQHLRRGGQAIRRDSRTDDAGRPRQVERERELRRAGAQSSDAAAIEFFHGILRHSLHNAMVVIRGRAEHIRDDVPSSKQAIPTASATGS